MKHIFMLCNNCLEKAFAGNGWLVDSHNCTCIFLEEAPKPVSLNGHTMAVFLVQHEAAKQTKEMFQMAKDTMSPEEYKRFCFENGVTP